MKWLVVAAAHDWSAFKAEYGKAYDQAEELMRRQVFEENLKFIEAENAKNHSFTLGVTQFADLTEAEFVERMRGTHPPAYGGAPYLGDHEYGGEELPTSVDWTAKGAVTPVKDQGQCGSCWAFSTTGAIEGAVQIQSGKLPSISEQQFVDCPSAVSTFPPLLGCKGGSMSGGFKFAEGHALCSEESYPYEAKGGTCRSSTCSVAVDKGQVTGYKGLSTLARITHATEQQLMSAIAQQPVSVGVEAAASLFQHYTSGVFGGDCGSMPLGMIDHGVLAVGYGTDPSGGDYWKIKNSWAATWGDKGYIRLKRGTGGYGQCHVLSSPSYPVVKASEATLVV